MSTVVKTIFDTGKGPDLTWEGVLPTSWLADIQPLCVSVKDAGNLSFWVEGVIRPSVEIGGPKAKAVSEVAPKLTTIRILGTAFFDKEITRIDTKRWQTIPGSRHAVAIVAKFQDEDAVQFSGCTTTRPVCTLESIFAVCRVAEAKTVLPWSESSVLVWTFEAGTYMAETATAWHGPNQLSIEKRIVEILSHQPFYIMVVNTLQTLIRLPKEKIVTMLGKASSKFVSVQEEAPVTSVNAVPIYKAKQNIEGQFDQHQEVTTIDNANRDDGWKIQLSFNQKYDAYRQDFQRMMSKCSSMWNKRLGRRSVKKGRIQFKTEPAQTHLLPFCARPQQRQLEREGVDKMLKDDIAEAATTW